METIFTLINHEVPAWVVVIIAIFQATLSFLSKLRRFALLLRDSNRRIAYWVRRWLRVAPIVNLTQREYDALPYKDPNTLYLIVEKPTAER